MLGHDGSWKLGDWGLARRKAEQTNKNTAGRGTEYYIAPEQARHRYSADVSSPADMFALGATFLEALAFKCDTRQYPERNEHGGFNLTHMKQIKADLKKMSFSRGVDLFEIVEQMCNFTPAQRPTPKPCKRKVIELKKRWEAES